MFMNNDWLECHPANLSQSYAGKMFIGSGPDPTSNYQR